MKFRDRLVVSRATLNIIEKVIKVKEPLAGAAKEEPEKKGRKFNFIYIVYVFVLLCDNGKSKGSAICITYLYLLLIV